MATQQPQPESPAVDISIEKHGDVDINVLEVSDKPSFEQIRRVCTFDNEKKMETQRQAWFENAIKNKLKIPSSYEEVSVLMIRWHPSIDDYRVGHTEEIRKLKAVFRRFGFSVSPVVCLNTEVEKPQNTLNLAIAQHIANHDGANKLMIIYYTGHGLRLGSDGRLAFAATTDAHKTKKGKHHAYAYWDSAEDLLIKKGVEPDVLTILDCCFASRAHKGPDDTHRLYDLLAACDKDDTTPAPGPGSFTMRLIATLEQFLDNARDESILTTKILEEMNKNGDSPAYLFDRLHKSNNRHVQLKPLSERTTKEVKQLAINFQNQGPEEAGINLRFSLEKPDLSKEKIEQWASALVTACESVVALRRIDWAKMEKNNPGQRLQRLVDIVHQAKMNPRQRLRKVIQTVIENNRVAGKRTIKRTRSEELTPVMSKRRAPGNWLTPFSGNVSMPMTPESNADS